MGAQAVDTVWSGLTRVILVLSPTTPTACTSQTACTMVAELLALIAPERIGYEGFHFKLYVSYSNLFRKRRGGEGEEYRWGVVRGTILAVGELLYLYDTFVRQLR